MSKLRIVLADDHAIMRDGLVSLIDAQPDMQVVGQAGNGREAVARSGEMLPDIIIMDVSMPELDGIQATRQLKIAHPTLKVLALTAYDNPVYVRQLFDAGATGYILKNLAAQELIHAIRTVAEGKTYLDPTMTKSATASPARERLRGSVRRGELTEREQEILLLVAQGYTNKEIALRLTISVKTVESHKGNIMTKLELKNRADAVRYAARQGWLRDA
ncbi:MAG: response regulator transcription factor [Pyrinomonadaceae bacterium MAG19_C2-C3]|nr:response regulator transcription factor [Pyrinomonadaceae bacterium MAG19_C2-C3]